MEYSGEIKARIIDVRFALSGKIVSANKRTGDMVKRGELIAALDRKILQTELDSELADYEKVRADFEIFNQKNLDPQSPVDKYLKTEKQADLNGSVKQVELAKAHLDQCDLFSPVEGMVLDDSGIAAGVYITPASASIKIIDTSSYVFETEIDQKDIPDFKETKKCTIEIDGVGNVEGETDKVLSDGKKFNLKIKIPINDAYLVGMVGKVTLT